MDIKKILFSEDCIVLYCDDKMKIEDISVKAEKISFFNDIIHKNIFNVFCISQEKKEAYEKKITENLPFIIKNIILSNEPVDLIFYPESENVKGNYICLVYSQVFSNNLVLQNNISTVEQSLLINENEIKGILHSLLPLGTRLEELELYDEKEKYIDEITKRCYNLMRNNLQAQHYYELINSISKINMKDVCMNVFLDDYFSAIRQLVTHAGYDIKLILCDQMVYAKVDIDKITLMLTNIISNSCLYSMPGITITLSLKKTKRSFTVIVRDNGSGMTNEIKAKMFDPFFSYDPNSLEKRSGMGLAVAKKIIEMHGGRTIVKSEVDVGTTISVILPIVDDTVDKSTIIELNEAPRIPIRNNGFSLIAVAFSQVYHFRLI